MKKSEIREQISGYLFILPFIIGFIFFFVYPLAQSFIWSFGEVSLTNNFAFTFSGMQNYIYALQSDATYFQHAIGSLSEMLWQVPIVLIFSFVIANFLKPKFKGRGVIRLIFFLPVILTTGVVTGMEENTLIQNLTGLATELDLQNFMMDIHFPYFFAQYISQAVEGISVIVNHSGIQILIFLAALQSISPSLYEASTVEGATAWDDFWKITFPMVLPQVIVALVYTIVDQFVNVNNKVITYIGNMAFSKMKFSISSAMAWIYSLIVVVILLLFAGSVSLGVRKYNK